MSVHSGVQGRIRTARRHALINTKRKTEVRCSQSCKPPWAGARDAEGEGIGEAMRCFRLERGRRGTVLRRQFGIRSHGRSGGNEGKLHGDDECAAG